MTSKIVLRSLTLKSFRGASTTFKIDFEKGKKLTLIYGENGCGKTTICDAFEFLAAERLGSLEDRGMGKGLEKYWPTAGKLPNDLAVNLETSSGVCSGNLIEKKIVILPTSAKPRIELLRRQQILGLIEAQPAERYNAIKRFIDIDTFQVSEEALRQTLKKLSEDKIKTKDRELENLSTLNGFFEVAGKPVGQNPVSWAKKQLKTSTESLDSEISAIGLLRTKYAVIDAFPERFASRSSSVKTAQQDLDTAETALKKTIKLATDGAIEMLQLLEAGHEYLDVYPNQIECPLCRSAEKVDGLSAKVKDRLGSLSALKEANDERGKRHNQLEKANDLLEQLANEYSSAREDFSKTISDHTWRSEVTLPKNNLPTDVGELGLWLADTATSTDSWLTLEANWRDGQKFAAALKSAVEQYDASLSTRLRLETLIPNIEKALGFCVTERQGFTDVIMAEIAQEVGVLYELVHPGEGLDKIAFPLDAKKRASVELQAKFSGHDVPPQAYFSQSHLDTLGLCVFLALALRDRPEDTVLILDDVLGSVDEPHVERVIQMIYGVSHKFQHTIVTTHYRPWREKYRWGWLKPDQPCQFIELATWTIDDGLRDTSSLPEIERLRTLLQASPIDPQAISSKAGVILEAALDYLTQRYECRVVRKFGGAYTLGDLLPAIGSKLREALVAEVRDSGTDGTISTVAVRLKPILEILEKIAQTRNVFGAHFKSISFELLESDTVRFAEQVVVLIDALTHPEHGWPSNDKSGNYWRNSGDTRRLYPLKRPS